MMEKAMMEKNVLNPVIDELATEIIDCVENKDFIAEGETYKLPSIVTVLLRNARKVEKPASIEAEKELIAQAKVFLAERAEFLSANKDLIALVGEREFFEKFDRIYENSPLDKLVLPYAKLIVKLAYAKYLKTGIPVEDLINSAFEGFVKSLNSFDPERGLRLISYAKRGISSSMRDNIARMRGAISVSRDTETKISVSLDDNAEDSEGNEISMIDKITFDGETPEEIIREAEVKIILKELWIELSPMERKLVMKHHQKLGNEVIAQWLYDNGYTDAVKSNAWISRKVGDVKAKFRIALG